MSKIKFSLFGLLLVLPLALGLARTALAEVVDLNSADDSIPITEIVNASPSANLEGITYTITIAPQTYGGESHAAARGNGVYAGITPTGGTPIVIKPADSSATTAGAAIDDSADASKSWTYGRTLPDLFGSSSNFPSAGMYEYTIKQTHEGGTSEVAGTWTYDEPEYLLQVLVKTSATDPAVREYAGWTLSKWNPAANGGSGAYEKVNSGVSSQDGAATFTDTYAGTGTLNVEKQVSGDYASTTYDFPVEVTLYMPSWYSGGISGISTTNASTTATNLTDESDGTKSIVYKTDLHHGEVASFDVPVGTRYKVDEKPAAGKATISDSAGLEYSQVISWDVDQTVPTAATFTELTSKVWRVSGTASNNYLVTSDDGVFTSDLDPLDSSLYSEVSTLKADAVAIATGNEEKISEYTNYMNNGDIFIFPMNTAAAELSNEIYDDTDRTIYNEGTEWEWADVLNPSLVDGDKALQMKIVGINHDDAASGGKAGLTFQSIHILPHYYRMNPCDYDNTRYDDPQNVGGWKESELRNIMNPDEITAEVIPTNNQYRDLTNSTKNAIWDMVPSDIQNAIVPVVKMTQNVGGANLSGMDDSSISEEEQNARLQAVTSYEVTQTIDKLWIPSLRELTSSSIALSESTLSWRSSLSYPWADNEGSSYAYWNSHGITITGDNPYLSFVNGVDGVRITSTNTGRSASSVINRSCIYPHNATANGGFIWARTVDPAQYRAFKYFGDGNLTGCYFAGSCRGITPCFCL